MEEVEAIRQALATRGQEQLLRFYDDLPQGRQRALLEQLDALDWDQIDALTELYVRNPRPAELADDITPPRIFPARPADDAQRDHYSAARQRGLEMLTAGKVAAFVVAGGQGTRLGYEGPKGCFEATPIAKKPLFQVFAEQILAASRRAGASIPWYIMTSPANDVATRAFFRQQEFFGLPAEDVFFFTQGTMPAIGLDGKLLLATPSALATSPDGHGGSLLALRRSGALADMAKRGVEVISYFQVDNPLVRCIDPLFIGLHDLNQAEMSAKALPKRHPLEKLGNFCMVGGKVTVIEYSDMPDDLARATTADGHLRFSAGSIAIHAMGREFVERLTANSQCLLPFHRAEKKVPFVDHDATPVQPDEPNAVKLEMFVFDAMPLASKTVILETDRSEEFSPIKNAQGDDSPTSSLHDQVRRAAEWLEDAGIVVPRDADGQIATAIEISPLFADSAIELARRIDPALVITTSRNLYLGSSKTVHEG